jgi:hypothetical protein
MVDFHNYKGLNYNDKNEKVMDQETGAHFLYEDMFCKIQLLKQIEDDIDDYEREAIGS